MKDRFQSLMLQQWEKFGKHSLRSLRRYRSPIVSRHRHWYIGIFDNRVIGVRLLGVILPTLGLLLSTSETAPTLVSSQTVAQLLLYATSSPAAFKDAAAQLDVSTKELLEQSLRRAMGGTISASVQTVTKPQISLRSF